MLEYKKNPRSAGSLRGLPRKFVDEVLNEKKDGIQLN